MSNADIAFQLLQWCCDRTQRQEFQKVEKDHATRTFLKSRNIDSLLTAALEIPDNGLVTQDTVRSVQLEAAREIMREYDEKGIRALIFKGAELGIRHFQHAIDFMADVDILVPRSKIEDAREVMYSLGYRHLIYDATTKQMINRDVSEVAAMELRHYELAPFVKVKQSKNLFLEMGAQNNGLPVKNISGTTSIVIEADIHHNVATDTDPAGLFQRAVPSSLGVGETLSSADHVWLNLSRHYNEVALHGSYSLRPFAYTIAEINAGRVDWEVVENISKELKLGPTLSYYLRFCDYLAPKKIPDSTLKIVETSNTTGMRDWGWQLEKLFEIRTPFPAQAFPSRH